MRGNELLDKPEPDEKPARREIPRVKWGAAAVCLVAVLLAGAFLLRGKAGKTVAVTIGGVPREYKATNVAHTLVSLEWPWEYKTTVERYTSLEWNGKTYYSRRCTVSPSLLGQRLGTIELTGGDSYSDEVHRLACEVYAIAGVSPELYAAVELDGEFYVFAQNEYAPPATLGEVLDSCSLPQTLTLVQFTRRDGAEESGQFRQDSDACLWSVLEDCREAEFVEDDPRWMETAGEYLSFTAESEALGVHNLAFYVTKGGYIWTNIFDYAYTFHIGEEAAGQIIDYALSHSEPSPREPLHHGLAGTLTGIEDGYLLIDDSVRCADPEDGMVFRVPLDDVRISRRIDFEGISVGDLVEVTFTGEIDVEAGNVVRGAYDLNECWIMEGEADVPL